MVARLRRSFLYTPTDSPGMIRKGPTTGADAVIYDLEDAVAPEDKSDARGNLRTVVPDLREDEAGAVEAIELCVRINGLETDHWLADLRAAADARVDTVHVPMVERAWHLRTVVEAATQLFAESPEFFALLETPRGIEHGREIAEAADGMAAVTGLSYGMSDYSVTIGASQKSDRVRTYLDQRILSFANVGTMDPVSPVYPDAGDTETVGEIARRAAELGFVGQTVIHPDQVEVVNETFTPSAEAAERAKRLVDAFEAADVGRTVAEGVFMDEAQVTRYRSVVERYEEITGDSL